MTGGSVVEQRTALGGERGPRSSSVSASSVPLHVVHPPPHGGRVSVLLAVAGLAAWLLGLVVTWVNLGVVLSLAVWVWVAPGFVLFALLWREQSLTRPNVARTRPAVAEVPTSRGWGTALTSAALALVALALIVRTSVRAEDG